MNLQYREQKNNNHGILSATRPKEPILDVKYKQENSQKTVLRQKKKIIVYVKENKYYIEHSAAFALGIVNVRAVMLNKPKLVEISYDTHNKLRSNDEIEIEYIALENKKEKLKVFVDNSSYCIENSTAYALGLINVEQFYNAESNYFYITTAFLEGLRAKYDVEMYSMSLHEQSKDKLM